MFSSDKFNMPFLVSFVLFKIECNRFQIIYINRIITKLSSLVPVIEKFEAEGRHPGDVSIADLPDVLKLKKELCEANVWYLEFVAYVL